MEALIGGLLNYFADFGEIITPILFAYLFHVMYKSREDSRKIRADILKDLETLKGNDLSTIRGELQLRTERYLNRGYMTFEGKQITDSLFDRYTLMGGNSFIKTNVERCNKLPIKEKRQDKDPLD